ncbi:MAG TPA: translation elongation factor Ts [Candidatus Acidoferrales bacterium]|nr:translation elongation factor Ts [Candidatus Acidoferrales bacterium]
MTTNPEPVNISAQLVKKLRELTGAGFNDCRAALAASSANMEKAVEFLRKKGQAAAQKKAEREATDGLVSCYIHAGGKIGVLLEVNCETDFVARTDEFQRLCHDLAMHIAALDPRFIRREEVTPEILEREREIARDQARQTGKPDHVIEKIVTGKMEKFYEENCLYEQHFIRDESVTVKEMIDLAIAKVGEKISVRRYVRMKVGDATATYAAGSSPRVEPPDSAVPAKA